MAAVASDQTLRLSGDHHEAALPLRPGVTRHSFQDKKVEG